MHVVIGGGSGFIGRALTQALRARGDTVTWVSRASGADRITWEQLQTDGLPTCDESGGWRTETRAMLSELRIDTGPGYRVYYATKGDEIILLLAGGDKSTQTRDIEKALTLWEDWKAENR